MELKLLDVEGHRGATTHCAENSIAAFREAIRLGIDGIEFDLWLLTDGEPVVCHGKSANGLEVLWNSTIQANEPKFLPQMSSKELPGFFYPDKVTHLPLFEELLRTMAESSLYLNAEVKDCRPELVRAVLERIKQIPHKCRIVFSSFNHAVRAMVDKAALELELPPFTFGFLVASTASLPPLTDGRPAYMREEDTLNIDITMVLADDPGLREYLQAVTGAGFRVKIYNLMNLTQYEGPALYEKIASYGISTFICNNVEALLDYNNKRTVRIPPF